jgi:hypothetical protein
MIGQKEAGYLIWSQGQGRVFLNFSPDGIDAGYSIDFPAATGELKGKGVTWYPSEPNPPPPSGCRCPSTHQRGRSVAVCSVSDGASTSDPVSECNASNR